MGLQTKEFRSSLMFVEEVFGRRLCVEGTYVEELGVLKGTLKVSSVICSQTRRSNVAGEAVQDVMETDGLQQVPC